MSGVGRISSEVRVAARAAQFLFGRDFVFPRFVYLLQTIRTNILCCFDVKKEKRGRHEACPFPQTQDYGLLFIPHRTQVVERGSMFNTLTRYNRAHT
jgi:hypothetical protein